MGKSQYADLPRLLCEWSPGFARSQEAAQVSDDLDLPTVVADAFGEYVLRLAKTGDPHDEQDIRYCAVEGLISRLSTHDEAGSVIERLGPCSTALHQRFGTNGR
jgi:hypothetical protein